MSEEGRDGQAQKPTKGVSLYSIVSAQASGISDASLRALAGTKLDEWKGKVDDALTWYDELFKNIPAMRLDQVKDIIYDWLVDDAKLLIDAWKAGLGLQMGTAFMGLEESTMGYPQLLSMYKIEQLEACVRPRLTRYWQSQYTPNVPDPRLAFRMLMEAQISRADFNNYCLQDGWSTYWHNKLYEVFNRDPDIYLAFSMYKRGLITEAKMYQCFRIAGYDATYDKALYLALHRRPSLREIMTLADYVPLPDLWVSEVLRADGYHDTDINYIVPAVRMRPLRDEVRSVVGRYLWEYQIGRIDRDTLKASLTKLGLLPKELELNLLWADLRYADELLDEELECIEARVEYGDPTVQTEDNIYNEIVALGIASEKANLMAELWYYKYVYVPP